MTFWRSAAKARDALAQADAIGRSQAVIEFGMDGTILTANENFLAAMGYRLSDIVGKYKAGEFKRVGNGGREIWIQASYNPILGAGGKPIKVVKFATDITAQKI